MRADYSSVKLKELFVDVDNFTNISTKSSSFDATFSVNMVWKDDRLSQLANNIALNAPAVEGGGKSFFCTIYKINRMYPSKLCLLTNTAALMLIKTVMTFLIQM